jgi:hypothetical protein
MFRLAGMIGLFFLWSSVCVGAERVEVETPKTLLEGALCQTDSTEIVWPDERTPFEEEAIIRIKDEVNRSLRESFARVTLVQLTHCLQDGVPFSVEAEDGMAPKQCSFAQAYCSLASSAFRITISRAFLQPQSDTSLDWIIAHSICYVMRSTEFSNGLNLPQVNEVEACVTHQLGSDIHAFYYFQLLDSGAHTNERLEYYQRILEDGMRNTPTKW